MRDRIRDRKQLYGKYRGGAHKSINSKFSLSLIQMHLQFFVSFISEPELAMLNINIFLEDLLPPLLLGKYFLESSNNVVYFNIKMDCLKEILFSLCIQSLNLKRKNKTTINKIHSLIRVWFKEKSHTLIIFLSVTLVYKTSQKLLDGLGKFIYFNYFFYSYDTSFSQANYNRFQQVFM